MKQVLFWSRIVRDKSEEWVLVPGEDASGVPEFAWKTFNKAFWNWKTRGSFYPLKAEDAYQVGCAAMVSAMENAPALTRAKLTTYLVSAAFNAMLKFKDRQVDPARAEHRALFKEARIGDVFDVRGFVEALPGLHSASRMEAKRLAAECVYATLAKLDAETQFGLRAWIAADGIWTDAAKIYDPSISIAGYVYRFRHVWSKAFKKACEWTW